MKKFLQEFKEFALKGNVLDLAVGVIIGAAFKDIVTSLTDNFINPILLFITAGDPIGAEELGVYASNFVTAVINFIIMAFILFCIVKAINKMMTIGKKKEEVDLVLEDLSVSRMHARITREQEDMYLEDLNSTNGTYKNGLRLNPYERRALDEGDEIKCGRCTMVFR